MVTLENFSFNDSKFDVCGSETVAVLKIDDSIIIPLCQKCLDNLENDLTKFRITTFCRDCAKWHCSKCGADYGGTCEEEVKKEGKSMEEISPDIYGDVYWTNSNETCEFAVRREN